MSQQVNVYRKLKMFPGAIVEGALGQLYDPNSRTYYVNNITGSSTADGLSWNSAVDQVSTAVTLSEASRLIHPGTTTNDYIRNRIIVQGTGTSYSLLAALPSYCDVVGLGASSYGDGAGIAVIGSAAADGIAGTARGLNLYNLQFQAGGAFICADFVSLFRSEIDSCTFQARTTDNASGIRFSAASSGNHIHDCMWTAGGGAACTGIGIDIEGVSFTMNRIENNFIRGVSSGVYVVSTCVSAGATVFQNNIIGYSGCAIGVDDNATVGTIVYAGNYLDAGTAGTLVHNHTRRWVCNYLGITFSTSTNS